MSSSSSSVSASASNGIKLVLGTMEFGRYADSASSLMMTEFFLSSSSIELDTAVVYAKGQSEAIIGSFPDSVKSRIVIHTKANPWWKNESNPEASGLSAGGIAAQSKQSLTSLKLTPSPSSPPLDIYYLHAPDHTVPIETSLAAMNELHQLGVFKRLGLSNFASWQVMEAYQICKEKGYVLPSVYQGMYNAITRDVERELFPCLKKLKISFYLYNPLAGGILTGKYTSMESKEAGNRFHGNDASKMYSDRYWKPHVFDSIRNIIKVLNEVYGEGKVSITEASFRWILYHSQMSSEFGDAIIFGASKLAHLEENVRKCQEGKGKLDDRVVKAFDEAWNAGKADVTCYFR